MVTSLVSRLNIVHTCIYIYAFKEAVLKYRSLNSNVYSWFLDASKAFDRINNYVLFEKTYKAGHTHIYS